MQTLKEEWQQRKEIKGKWDKDTRKQGANKEGKRKWGKYKIEERRMKGKKVGRKRIGNKRISRTVSVYTTLHSFVCCNRDLLVSRLPPFSSISPQHSTPSPFQEGCVTFLCRIVTSVLLHPLAVTLSLSWGVSSYSASRAKTMLAVCGCIQMWPPWTGWHLNWKPCSRSPCLCL